MSGYSGSNPSFAVTDYNQSPETQTASAFYYAGNAVNLYDNLFELRSFFRLLVSVVVTGSGHMGIIRLEFQSAFAGCFSQGCYPAMYW